jgi:hypothetical protein
MTRKMMRQGVLVWNERCRLVWGNLICRLTTPSSSIGKSGGEWIRIKVWGMERG